jgi:hypothetical protein
VTGLHNPHKCTLRVGVFNKRKLTATFSDPENQVQVPAVWIDRAGVKASLTEVSEGTATSGVISGLLRYIYHILIVRYLVFK